MCVTYSSKNIENIVENNDNDDKYDDSDDENDDYTIYVKFADINEIMFSFYLCETYFSVNAYPTIIYPKKKMQGYENIHLVDVFYSQILPEVYKDLCMDLTIERNLVFNNIKKSNIRER